MITLRPHHILCLQGFQNKGYSDRFTQELLTLHKQLQNNKNQHILIKKTQDSICTHCPHSQNNQCHKDSESNQRMMKRDQSTLKQLSVTEGLYTWSHLIKISQKQISSQNDTYEICFECDWQKDCLFYQNLKPCDYQSQFENASHQEELIFDTYSESNPRASVD